MFPDTWISLTTMTLVRGPLDRTHPPTLKESRGKTYTSSMQLPTFLNISSMHMVTSSRPWIFLDFTKIHTRKACQFIATIGNFWLGGFEGYYDLMMHSRTPCHGSFDGNLHFHPQSHPAKWRLIYYYFYNGDS